MPLAYVLGQTFFVRFLGELKTQKSPFEINWPLARSSCASLSLNKKMTRMVHQSKPIHFLSFPSFLLCFCDHQNFPDILRPRYNINKIGYVITKFHVQVNNYEIVVNFFHISHNLIWYSAIVHKFTKVHPVCSTYELTKQFL